MPLLGPSPDIFFTGRTAMAAPDAFERSLAMNDDYIFSNHADAAERRRLQMLEQVHDPHTVQLLARAGLRAGLSCAEVGAGAGSIARHMRRTVGPGGRVVAVDLDPRFLGSDEGEPLEVRKADITTAEALETEAYDLIHARFLLVHLPDPAAAIGNIRRALKPGGVLVLEEPDFRTAFSAAEDPQIRASVDAVNRSICALYVGMGKDPGFGIRLPGLVRAVGLDEATTDVWAPLAAGGDLMARMMGASVLALRQRLVQTGAAIEDDVDRYLAASVEPGVWASYYATVCVVGRKTAGRPRDLSQVRTEIDALDRQLVRKIAARSRLVAEAGRLKRTAAEVQAPARVEQVIAKARDRAAECGAPIPVVEATYRAMISAFIDFEHAARRGAAEEGSG